MKLQLPQVTLIAVAGNNQAQTVAAIYKSIAQVDFGAVKLITNINISANGIEVINVGGLNTWQLYNEFLVKNLNDYFTTDYCLVIQWDGYVLDAKQWDDEFFDYDYIGSKWLDLGKPFNVGNGGFSLRSKRLQTILANDSHIEITTPEDNVICRIYAEYLKQKHNIKFATEEIADKFAFELNMPLQETFGFHGFHHAKYKPTVVIKRTFAMGDVIMTEPVMHYFHKKGYNVVLDCPEAYYSLFKQHYFPVYSISQVPAKYPIREINLDMAYECFPQQNHLKSYYQFAEIEDGEMRNPLLRFESAFKNKLFKKYAVIHIDDRPEPYRNVYGIDWEDVALRLKEKGYDVIQVGTGKHYKIKNAVEINTSTEGMLLYAVGGADLFVGIDSGISNIASAFQVPSIIFFGSVNPEIIFPDLMGKVCINNHEGEGVCNQKWCWHNSVSTNGQECYVDKEKPPCTQYKQQRIIDAINELA